MSRLHLLSRATFAGLTTPIARSLLHIGLSADMVTLIGTIAAVIAALTLFPTGHLFSATLIIGFFVVFDMLDGAMARLGGGGSKFGAVLDATCDRISDAAIFIGLTWWANFGLHRTILMIATLICLTSSGVISYIKAKAQACGLSGDGGYIERPERLIITLVGAGLSDLPYIEIPYILDITMWFLAGASIITCIQRMHTVYISAHTQDSSCSHQ